MTPQRRKFDLALMDIRRCLVDPPMKGRADVLRRAAVHLNGFVESIGCNPEKTQALIDTVRAVRDSPGPGSTVAEARLMQALSSIAFWCEGGAQNVPPPETETERRLEVLRELAAYALECLAFRRLRDAFRGRRRSLAFEILTIHPHVDLPEVVRVARSIACSASGDDCRGALDFLKERFARLGREAPRASPDGTTGRARLNSTGLSMPFDQDLPVDAAAHPMPLRCGTRRAFVGSKVRNAALAADLAQETLLRVETRLRTLRSRGSPRRVGLSDRSKSTIADHFRKTGRRPRCSTRRHMDLCSPSRTMRGPRRRKPSGELRRYVRSVVEQGPGGRTARRMRVPGLRHRGVR